MPTTECAEQSYIQTCVVSNVCMPSELTACCTCTCVSLTCMSWPRNHLRNTAGAIHIRAAKRRPRTTQKAVRNKRAKRRPHLPTFWREPLAPHHLQLLNTKEIKKWEGGPGCTQPGRRKDLLIEQKNSNRKHMITG